MGVSTIRTGLISSQFSLNTCWDIDSYSMKPIGTSDYVVIFYSPSQSVAYGPGHPGMPTTSKRSGFSILQTDSGMQTMDPHTFFTDTNFS